MTPDAQTINGAKNSANELALRDIHLPDSILWWPPAPGWWILLFLIIVIAVSIYFFLRQRKKKRLSALYLAKQELGRIENAFSTEKDKSKLIKQLSELIRRVSISLFHRHESASLTGKEWLLFLDDLMGDDSFSNGIGKVLIEAPYQAEPEYDEQALLQLISKWIDSVQTNQKKLGKKGNRS
jgi:hypothetical protein